jgi:hypothetical protein
MYEGCGEWLRPRVIVEHPMCTSGEVNQCFVKLRYTEVRFIDSADEGLPRNGRGNLHRAVEKVPPQ